MSWVCDVPGADPATFAWHATLHLGLAGFVVAAGTVFLWLAVVAYRRPIVAVTREDAGS